MTDSFAEPRSVTTLTVRSHQSETSLRCEKTCTNSKLTESHKLITVLPKQVRVMGVNSFQWPLYDLMTFKFDDCKHNNLILRHRDGRCDDRINKTSTS